MNNKIIIILFASIIFFPYIISDAYAYLDPGTGSMIFQVLKGALVGVGLTIRIYWQKIRFGLSKKFAKDADEI